MENLDTRNVLFDPQDNFEIYLTEAQVEDYLRNDVIQEISNFEAMEGTSERGFIVCDEYAEDFENCTGPFDWLS